MKRNGLLLQFNEIEYGNAWQLQKSLLEARVSGKIEDCLILLQHPPTFTYGRRYKEDNLITNKEYYESLGFAVYKTDRGGLATYHGPGQLVGYPIIKISTYTKDYYQYLRMLEEVMIRTLIDFGISARRNEGYTGIWVNNAKVGFIGVRMSFGYAMHGFSLNVNNDVSPFNHITPCGIQGVRVTSVQELLNTNVNMQEVYAKLTNHFSYVFQIQMVSIEKGIMSQRIGFEMEKEVFTR
ncbi:MAG TPA: lipoyl(octanoyl) transferase LipB [Candidatus Wunengus sp. YC63]|uniref:lipoyl(octanoyl) transferase LipB n=1 Tax=unclassified Candidatus Wunengus TaxID=3367695 RepID=UPI004029B5B0